MHGVHSESLSKSEKRALWDELIQLYLTSGQTLKSFSESHGLKSDHLSYYVTSYKRKQQSVEQSFIPIGVSPGSASSMIEINTKTLQVKVPLNTPQALLDNLFK